MARQVAQLMRARGPLAGVVVFTAVAIVLTAMVAGTLSRSAPADAIEVDAIFSDATGLRVGDDVRVAGVRIGRVTATRLGDGDQRGRAIVTFSVPRDQRLRADTVAAIDYLNLMGQRFVALSRPENDGDPSAAGLLKDGAVIGLESTRPALDLTALFNAFRPIFDLLQPDDINELAGNLVAMLQGRGPTLRHLLSQTGDITAGIAQREDILDRVVANVTTVLDATETHRAEITDLIDGLGDLTTGLAADRDRLADSLDSLARLSATTAQVVEQAGPSLVEDARLSAAWFRYLRSHRTEIIAAGGAIPKQLATYLRTLGYGSYLNVYICSLYAKVKGVPAALDLGPGDRHSARCP